MLSLMDWAVGHPERIKDWGHRGNHFSTVASKAIIAAYYGSAPRCSYFTGCSHGGGSGLAEAQRYPEDYDGIIAGAFGSDWTGVSAAYVFEAQCRSVWRQYRRLGRRRSIKKPVCTPDIDRGMKAPTPDAGKTPVIPPPGSPGGNPNVQPK